MKEIQVHIPTYRTLFKFKIYKNESKMLEENNEILAIFNDGPDQKCRFNARAYDIYLDDDGFRSADVVIKSEKLTHGTIAHELLHSTAFILNYCGIPFDESTEEAYTHLVHYITDSLYIELERLGIKVKLANI